MKDEHYIKLLKKLSNSMKDEHYTADVVCENCGYAGEVKIKNGSLIKQKACPECGCAELRRKKRWARD
jgi:hypothetical protein